MSAPLPIVEPQTVPFTGDPLQAPLLDAQGRTITYLRFSITDRCNFRCTYCSPSSWGGTGRILSTEEILRVVSVFARMGIRRVRLTGGEPTFRKDILDIARGIRDTAGIGEICMTTNGHLLADMAKDLLEAGVTKLNISIDTLDPDRFARVTKSGDLKRVLDGIEACLAAGYTGLKLNAVVMKGVNEDDVLPLIRYAWARGITPRFIECMPFAEGKPVPTLELIEKLKAQGLPLEPARDGCELGALPAGPSEYWRGEGGLVGFIGPLTRNFCGQCNRVRVAANGDLRACLGGRERVSLSGLLREGGSDEQIALAIREALNRKPDGHRMTDPDAKSQLLSMMGIGG